ncbi:beta/gamma crystallin domain-containing protein 1 isoform X2 [Erinaceus europaeus]|uniref:Beta/gamma crystallin domain-containing protein 1 isoform X2 n=1 Tax=Erinaceus europaeus TaxID=9365 RepID=A0ABM3XCW6_ERIEU|nr:beta/gamma crystallin domain-containing protein 1 isoform X2 [Erinaceus europaeus]
MGGRTCCSCGCGCGRCNGCANNRSRSVDTRNRRSDSRNRYDNSRSRYYDRDLESRAQPPEENKRKPVLGKLGNLFTAGRRRSTRNGGESPTSSNAKSLPPKDVTSSQVPDSENRSTQPDSPAEQDADPGEEGSPLKAQEPGEESSDPCPQAAPQDAELSLGPSSPAAAAAQQCHEGDSPQLEPLEVEGETFPDATTAAKQNSAGREAAEARARCAGEDAGGQQETPQGPGGVSGPSGQALRAAGPEEAAERSPGQGAGGGGSPEPPEGAPAAPGEPPARGADRPGQPAHVLAFDIYLSKTEVAAAAEDCSDPEDMDKRPGGRRSGRRRRAPRAGESPAAAHAAGSEDPVAAPGAPADAEQKVKPGRAAAEGGAASAAAASAPASPGPRGQPRADAERSRPAPPAASPTKRRGKSRLPEAGPTSSPAAAGAARRETPPKKAPEAAKAAPGDSAEEAARGSPRELTVKSSSLLPEIRPEHKRGPLLFNHFDGRGEGSRCKEVGRATASSDPDGLKPRNHFGASRSTVTTKVTLPAKPKHVELNLKTPKNLDSLGNEHNPFSQPVHKGNTATKISLFENKRATSSPRHADVRGPRNTAASSKTFVGRAKLNLAKKAKEMEQPEKKVTPSSQQNGVLGKDTSSENKVTLPGEDVLPATQNLSGKGTEGESSEAQGLASQLSQGDEAETAADAGCPAEPLVTAQVPVRDHKLFVEDSSSATDSTTPGLEHRTAETAQDSLPVLDTSSVPAAVSALQEKPPAESSSGPSLSLPASSPPGAPDATCTHVPISHCSGVDLKVSENHNGCALPVSHQNNEEMPPAHPAEGGTNSSPLSAVHSSEAVGRECPSTVLVQVRSFVLPEKSTQGVSSQVVTDSSEVREVQLPSCHDTELEAVSLASCDLQKEEVQGPQSTSPTHSHSREEPGAESGPQVSPPGSQKALPVHTQNQSDGAPPIAEPGSRNHLETPPRSAQNAVNGQDSPASLLNISADSEDSVFDSSSDMEKFTEIIKKMDSMVCVPQKKKKARVPNSPTPYFAMPPIHEDNLEKVLDPNVFTFGLGKKKESQPEMSPALHLMQSLDTKSKLRPKRTSTEESFLFRSLHAHTNGREEPLADAETHDKDNRDVTNGGVKRSRLEKSALFSSILSSLPQDKIFSPSVTSVNTMTTAFSTSQNTSLSRSSASQPVAEGAPPSRTDKVQPNLLPGSSSKVFNFDASNASHSGLKSPSYMEKFLQREETKKDVNSRSNLHFPETKFSEFLKPKKKDDPEKAEQTESVVQSSLSNHGNSDMDFVGIFTSSRFDPNIAFSGMSLSESAILRGNTQNKINPRPGKVVIYIEPDVSEECIEVFGDVQDCSSWSLSPAILLKVVRGCWILYEKPNFEGHSIPLEEGEVELSGLWGIDDDLEKNEETESAKPVVIGSIRRVVQDYRVSQIDLFTEPEGLGLLTSYFDDIEEMQGFGIMQKTCSIKVHWGTWLIYEGPGFQGDPFILEPGEYPDLSFWDTEEAYIGSMRPLKMGGRKVEFPTDPKVVIYEKPFFEGRCVELETEMYSFTEGEEAEEAAKDERLPFPSVGSMKVLRGVWVAYEKPGFSGHQYLLEEGEYKDWKDWGGYSGELQSLRPVLGDFTNAHMIMYSEKNFGAKGSSIDVLGIVADLKETGYGVKTQSINVLSGVWVAYENPDFTGEQYILDKGFYTTFEDWGGKNYKISSVQPICLDSFSGPRRRNQIHLFSEPQFQGCSQSFEETTGQIDDSFSAKSCRVVGGSWVAYDGENFSGNQYVLEEGHYPCLSAMGCLSGATFKSLRFIDAEFSEPRIILFEREDFKGKKIELNAETVNLRSLGFNTQIRSVQVIGGIWVTYEYGNYRGRQFLLSPADVPNWYEFSGCRQIGSLRPFVQKRIYFRLRNKATGLFMSTNGNLEDLKLLRIQVMEDVGADDQIWIYQEGCIKCRIAEDCCLTIVGSLVTSGSKLGLALDQSVDSQFWSMKSDGRIYSKLKPNLVLDVKGRLLEL